VLDPAAQPRPVQAPAGHSPCNWVVKNIQLPRLPLQKLCQPNASTVRTRQALDSVILLGFRENAIAWIGIEKGRYTGNMPTCGHRLSWKGT
jgi:hypothetical protein